MSNTGIAVLPASTPGYGGVTQALHWIAALAIIATWGLGMSLEAVPRGPTRGALISVHSTLGILVFSFSVLRLLWRGVTPAPAPEGPGWLAPLSRAMHAILYAVTVALPVTGLLARWAHSGAASLIGGWSIPAPFPLPATRLWAETHVTIAIILGVLVAGHVGAALFHHFVLRDATLRRMLRRGQVSV